MAGLIDTKEEAGAPAAPPKPYRWVVLLGVWLIYMSFGMTMVSLAPLVLPITRDLGISHTSMGLVFGLWQAVFIVAAVPCGALLDRIGPRLGLLIGALTIAASGYLRSVSADYLTLCLAVALFGIGGPIVSTGAPKVVSNWFRGAERGFAMGLYITGPAIGNILALSLTNAVLMPAFGDDWHRVLQVWAIFALLAGLAWVLICTHPTAQGSEMAVPRGPRPSQLTLLRDLIRLPAVRILLAMSVGIFLFNHSINNWLPELLRNRGFSPVAAGYWATVPTVIGILGSLLIPRLATPERRYMLLAWLCVAALAASLLLQLAWGPALTVGLMLQGIARSSLMTVSMLTLVETPGIGERHAATASGLFFSAAEVGGASGPMLLGMSYDATGGFAFGLASLSGVAIALLAGSLMLRSLARRVSA